MSSVETIPVALGADAYDVVVGAGLLAEAGARIAPYAKSKRVFVATDENVARLHLDALEAALGGLEAQTIVLPPGEAQKSFDGLERICTALIEGGVHRNDLVIAFGGGVIGDLAGLAAGLVLRGVDFVQIPTTLLAQVDSSVGGKTAIDLPAGKNLVGLFHQPRLVLIDVDLLQTLPPRELRAGFAEVAKYGLIDNPEFFSWCERNARALLAGDAGVLKHAIGVSVREKARIVAADEKEHGARALLNLGHTFAHALEASAGYDGALLHGEAVGAGMALAFKLSADLGLCPKQEAAGVVASLSDMGLDLDLKKLPGGPFDAVRMLAAMAHDKKAEAGKLNLILARGIGRAFVQKDAPEDAVRALLQRELA
ncbi:MAG: 3-dehydroquinate synthase [Hyphomonadaceae bacterium]|nr:3-dehydroquinate synthase [Hyphomonadaceae bacterium]